MKMIVKTNDYSFDMASMDEYAPDGAESFIVEGLLLAGEVSLVYGPSNVGKTAAVVQIAKHIACGERILGREVRQGIVFYVAAESPRSVKDRAFAALGSAPGRQNFQVIQSTPNLSDGAYADALIAAVGHWTSKNSRLPPALIVFDTCALSIGDGDENSNSDMSRVVALARNIAEALDCHVMLIHHAGKDSERGARGASALKASVDTEISCIVGEDGKGRLVQIKQRNLEKGAPIAYAIRPVEIARDEKDRPITAAVADLLPDTHVSIEKPARASSTDGISFAVETALMALTSSGLPASTDQLLNSLPERLFKPGLQPQSRRKAVDRALCDLVGLGVIHQTKDGNRNFWNLAPPSQMLAAE